MDIADGALTSLTACWELCRADGAGLALTSHDQPLVRDGVRYEPAPGMVPAAISRSLGLDPDSGEVAGALSTGTLDDRDLGVGRWDGAQMRMFLADWTGSSDETIVLLSGEIGPVASVDADSFTADLVGAAARLDEPVCPATSAECRAHFGDKKCRVDLRGRTLVAKVETTNGLQLALDKPVDERFVLGRLRYLSGLNCRLSTTILAVEGSTVQLRDVPSSAVEGGCRVELREGCDKRLTTCVSRFANGANFRGEPHLPGNDLLTRYPGA